jgi:signal transduction histidine kinase
VRAAQPGGGTRVEIDLHPQVEPTRHTRLYARCVATPWRVAPDLGPYWSPRGRRVLSIVMLGTLAAGSLSHLGRHAPGHRVVVVALLLGFTAFWVVLMGLLPRFETRPRTDFTLIVGLAATGLALQALTGGGQAYAAAYFSAGIGGVLLNDRVGIVWTTIVAGTAAIITGVEGQGPFNSLLILAGSGFFYLTGRASVLSRQATLAALASSEAEAARAAEAERSRIARELHDVLAHTLSGLSVQLEATRLLAETRQVDPAVLQQLVRAQGLAASGLEESRRAVHALRDTASLPGPEQLEALVDDFRSDTGVPCRLRVDGDSRETSPAARVALYRTAQEALTNVRRHARPERVDVVLRWLPDTAELLVTDIGAPAQPQRDGGFGLRGMRERAELAGGSLLAGPTPTGWSVCLRVPA